MSETDFIARWRTERASYEAWGGFIVNEILAGLPQLFAGIEVGSFVKIPVIPRVKTEDSLISKAFYRGKPYTDPFAEIEDKIGVRFVVLLTADIEKISHVIDASKNWKASLDRDFEAERESRPLEFVYQSKHYVVRANDGLSFDGVPIPAGTPCEIQIRTLLQHAHSELTHDNIYKREEGTEVTKKVERTIAKSMALIEAVDDYFVAALEELKSATEKERSAMQALNFSYEKYIGLTPVFDKSGIVVLSAYKTLIGDELLARIARLIDSKSFVVDIIKKRMTAQLIYRQPWILFAYLIVAESPRVAEEMWPFPVEDLRPIFVDLGKSPRTP